MNIEEIIKTLELDPEPRSLRSDWARTFDEDSSELTKEVRELTVVERNSSYTKHSFAKMFLLPSTMR